MSHDTGSTHGARAISDTCCNLVGGGGSHRGAGTEALTLHRYAPPEGWVLRSVGLTQDVQAKAGDHEQDLIGTVNMLSVSQRWLLEQHSRPATLPDHLPAFKAQSARG